LPHCELEAELRFSVAPNPGWTEHYATAPEIWVYFNRVATKWNVREYIQFKHKISEIRWDQDAGKYAVTVERADGKQPYTDIEKALFRENPETCLEYRKKLEHNCFKVMITDSKDNQMAQEYMTGLMKERLKNYPKLCKLLIADWPGGCRRLTPGEGKYTNNCKVISDLSLS
jgi:hypothetical protein